MELKLKSPQTAVYLGAIISTEGYRPEVEKRMQKANAMFHRLNPLWRQSNCAETALAVGARPNRPTIPS